MAEYSHLSEVDPEIAKHLESFPKWELEVPSIDQIRQRFGEVMVPKFQKDLEPFLPPSSEYTIKDHHIEVGGGIKVLARCITPTPREGEDTFPLLFWIHGGAFFLGDLHMDDYRLRMTSVKLRVTIVNCEYRLAPEHPFPAAVDDLTAALKFVTTNPDTFSASLKKGFIIGGASAGGNLAAVLSWMARDDPFYNDKPVTGQLLIIPVIIHDKGYPEKYKSSLLSLEQNKDAPILGKSDVVQMFELYGAPPTDPRVSPLLLRSHEGLPPAFIQACGLDPLRDEALLYGKVLKQAGVPTKLVVYSGVPHGFEGLFFHIKKAEKARENFDKGLQWLLEGAIPDFDVGGTF
ncbi:hypothetical protein L218DRAFT_945665 [Marasmius fiardii PR-910]|nr:hypothetical protein L218DRAFT_945665 [Marasmius fiardii PR-910]